jgi:hypothetical protein
MTRRGPVSSIATTASSPTPDSYKATIPAREEALSIGNYCYVTPKASPEDIPVRHARFIKDAGPAP